MNTATDPILFEPPLSVADAPALVAAITGIAINGSAVAFERALAEYHGVRHGFTFSAGRIALAAILDALEIAADDEVIVPAYTCVAVPNPILFRGARPVYADVERDFPNVDVEDVNRKVTPKTRAIVVQHTFGYPANMAALGDLATARGLPLIEDCTHALGAELAGRRVGTFGYAAFFSFEQSKVICTGQGGAALTGDADLAARMANFRRACSEPGAADVRRLLVGVLAKSLFPAWGAAGWKRLAEYYLARLGLSREAITTDEEYRCEKPATFERGFSDAQAKVGMRQLADLERNLARRREIAEHYFAELDVPDGWLMRAAADMNPTFLRLPVRVPDKAALIAFGKERNVWIGNWFSAPIHPLGVPQDKAGYVSGSCPHAEDAVNHIANLPCHPRMTNADVRRVVDVMNEFSRRYARHD